MPNQPKHYNISFRAAVRGLHSSLKREKNFQIELVIGILTVAAGAFLSLSMVEWSVIVFTITLVLGFELINTAFERLSDLQKPRLDNLVKLSKDVSAAAVLVVSFGALIIGLLILVPHLVIILL